MSPLGDTALIVSGGVTFTPAEFAALSNEIYTMALAFGYIACVVGVVLGFWIGYTVCQYRQKKEEL